MLRESDFNQQLAEIARHAHPHLGAHGSATLNRLVGVALPMEMPNLLGERQSALREWEGFAQLLDRKQLARLGNPPV